MTNLDHKYFVGSGCFHFLLRDASAAYPANNIYSPNPQLCPADEALRVVPIEKLEPMIIYEQIQTTVPLPTYIPDNPGILPGSLNLRCVSQ